MKMKKQSTCVLLQYEEKVQVGNLKATLVAQVCVGGIDDNGKLLMDIDFVDITDQSFEDRPITDWKKFVKFHEEMGIDIDDILNKKFAKIFDDTVHFRAIVKNDLENLFK